MGKLADKDIRDQLNRILASEEFSAAKRLSGFLRFVVSETLEERVTSLHAYTLALEVFDRSSDFDPQHDTLVRVHAGQLRLRLGKYYSQSGKSDPIMIKIPKGGYVPVFSEHAISERSRATSEVDRIDPTPSIFVLPFSNLSNDPDNEYFGLGLTEDIIAALSCFPDINLVARNLKSQEIADDIDFVAVAKGLNIRFLLGGSVRYEQMAVRISARVIDTENGEVLWSRSYDRKRVATDIFEVENEIAEKVAAEIAGPSGDISRHDQLAARRRPPEGMSAYDAVLRAYAYRLNPNSKDHREITVLLKAAVTSEPNYSDAAMMQSLMYLDQGRMLFNLETTVEAAFDQAMYFAKLAIELAPKNSVAWHLLSLTYFQKRDFSLCEHAAERSLSLSPNHPDTLADFGFQLWSLGQRERGLKMVEKALSLTPFPPGIYYISYVHEEYLNGRDEMALQYALMLGADDLFWKYFMLAAIYGQLGRTADAHYALCKVNQLNPAFGKLAVGFMEGWPFPPTFKLRLIDGLRKAGYVFLNEPASWD
ncbi:MAG: hypothetical protein JKX84_10455 [Flavobacteriales bacterium]|nr:hypothetical protein [Flavobacteriales bacterium]